MAIPSGSGTEVLKRATKNALNNATFSFGLVASGADVNVGTNHIVTILSITIHNTSGSTEVWRMDLNDGSDDIRMIGNENLTANTTFVWNDKFVLTSGDTLKLTVGSQAFDIVISYIDQDWS